MKTTGALWNRYMASWPDGQWFDDSDEHVGPVSLRDGYIPKDDDIVEFSCGVVFKSEHDHEGKSLIRHFSAWKKSLSFDLLVCEVPKDKVAQFLEYATSMGVEIKTA